MLAVVRIKRGISSVEIDGYDRNEEIIASGNELLMAALYRAPRGTVTTLRDDLKPELQRAYPEVTEVQVIFHV